MQPDRSPQRLARKSDSPDDLVLGFLAVTWRLPGGYLAVTWRLPGGYLAVTWRLLGGYLAVTWRLPGGYLAVARRCHLVGKSTVFLRLLTMLAVTWRLLGGYLAVTWRLLGGYLAVTWRLLGGYLAVAWRLLGGYLAVTWRLLGGLAANTFHTKLKNPTRERFGEPFQAMLAHSTCARAFRFTFTLPAACPVILINLLSLIRNATPLTP